ncbi:hypothetical protein [Nostoc sp. C117]|uniref:hypothetical protein n=1 Tax=Nostoc sp. C117 TaxID=3349875 RepID=UPI00370CFC50
MIANSTQCDRSLNSFHKKMAITCLAVHDYLIRESYRRSRFHKTAIALFLYQNIREAIAF